MNNLIFSNDSDIIVNSESEKTIILTIYPRNKRRVFFPFATGELQIKSLDSIYSNKVYSFNETEIDLTFDVNKLKRGYYQTATLTITITDFFGLFKRTKSFDIKLNLYILPKNSNDALSLFNFLNTEYLALQKSNYTNSFNIKSLREYQEGDPLNLIDWKSSSKRNELITKVYESERNRVSTFYFFGIRNNFERLVSLAYTYALYLLDSEEIFKFNLYDEVKQIEFIDILDFCKVGPTREEEIVLALIEQHLNTDKEAIVFTSEPSILFKSKLGSSQAMSKLTVIYYDDNNLNVVSNGNTIVYSSSINRGDNNEK